MGSIISIIICVLILIIGGIYLSKDRWLIMRLHKKIEDKLNNLGDDK